MNRRSFLVSFSAIVAAPAVIRVAQLMPIRGIKYNAFQFSTDACLVMKWDGPYSGMARLISDEMLPDFEAGQAPDICVLMAKYSCHRRDIEGLRFEASPFIRRHMDFQAMKDKNVLLSSVDTSDYVASATFRGIPIEVV